MDKRFLEDCLARGMSLEAIGEQVGKHPSTVGYWLKKHGLKAVGRDRFSPRGGLERGRLKTAVDNGLTLDEMANLVDRDISTVRYWLRRYGLKATGGTRRKETREAKLRGLRHIERRCPRHGRTRFVLENRGSYALQFHHCDPSTKSFSLSRRGCTRAFAELQAEAAKCVLLCANCHAEVEGGVTTVDPKRQA